MNKVIGASVVGQGFNKEENHEVVYSSPLRCLLQETTCYNVLRVRNALKVVTLCVRSTEIEI